jgi:hypothetical protein
LARLGTIPARRKIMKTIMIMPRAIVYVKEPGMAERGAA